jgi:hypothetical protein
MLRRCIYKEQNYTLQNSRKMYISNKKIIYDIFVICRFVTNLFFSPTMIQNINKSETKTRTYLNLVKGGIHNIFSCLFEKR